MRAKHRFLDNGRIRQVWFRHVFGISAYVVFLSFSSHQHFTKNFPYKLNLYQVEEQERKMGRKEETKKQSRNRRKSRKQ